MSLTERVRGYLRQRRDERDLQRAAARGYDTRPEYEVPPENDPGMGGVPPLSIVAEPVPGDIVDGERAIVSGQLCPNCSQPMKLYGVGLSGSVYQCDRCGVRL